MFRETESKKGFLCGFCVLLLKMLYPEIYIFEISTTHSPLHKAGPDILNVSLKLWEQTNIKRRRLVVIKENCHSW